MAFPPARTMKESYAFDYIEEATVADVMGGRLSSAYPEECADISGECRFSAAELPRDCPTRFIFRPRDCFGLSVPSAKLNASLKG